MTNLESDKKVRATAILETSAGEVYVHIFGDDPKVVEGWYEILKENANNFDEFVRFGLKAHKMGLDVFIAFGKHRAKAMGLGENK